MKAPLLRPAEDADRDPVLRWRNHPKVREVSLSSHEIGVDEHRAWWHAVAVDPDRLVLIYLYRDDPAGVVSFAGITAGPAPALRWAFHLDIDGLTRHRALVPAWIELERAAIAYAFEVLGAASMGGETLADNEPVLALHRRFGFQVTRAYPYQRDGVVREVLWLELTREAARW